MHVTINGKARETESGVTVEQLLLDLGLAGERIAVELNRNVLQAAEFAGTAIREGDCLEIVRFVGGG